MGATTREIRIDATVERVWSVIADYARYPEFVPGVRACRPAATVGPLRHVEYEVDLGVRVVRYVLAHREAPPHGVSWSLVKGDLLTRSEGSWELTALGGGTLARYSVDVALARPALVPQFVVDRVVDQLTRVQLPATLAAFKARAEGVA